VEVRVFLVEDETRVRDLTQELLAGSSFRVVATARGEGEAKLWLEDHADGWDLALVDLILSDGSGFGVIDAARRLGGARKIVVFSGYFSPGVVRHCLELGATAVLDKAQVGSLASRLSDLYRDDDLGPAP
jgi:two-component system, OmpR family, response regulator